jgi:5-carboxymethyl-2-hydroxymuconate isomerase
MPHLTLEYTSNIDQTIAFPELFTELHGALVDVAGIDIVNCKSRAVQHDTYHIAAGEATQAFAHLEIRLFTGRSSAIKTEIGRRSMNILETHLAPAAARQKLQISVEIKEIERQAYFRSEAE